MKGSDSGPGAGIPESENEALGVEVPLTGDPSSTTSSSPRLLPSSPSPRSTGRHHHDYRGSVLRQRADDTRKDHLYCLVLKKAIREDLSNRAISPQKQQHQKECRRSVAGGPNPDDEFETKMEDDAAVYDEEEALVVEVGKSVDLEASRAMMEELTQEVLLEAEAVASSSGGTSKLQEITSLLERRGIDLTSQQHRSMPLETRVKGFTYTVPVNDQMGKIVTVYNSSVLYSAVRLAKRIAKGENIFQKASKGTPKTILDNIDLIIEPGKSYLLLGPPGSGRSTLLKAVAGILRPSEHDTVEGSICYNGRTLEVRETAGPSLGMASSLTFCRMDPSPGRKRASFTSRMPLRTSTSWTSTLRG